MKKYRRLILLVTLLLSLMGLLVYSNEYYKLRANLEMFNIFSAPLNPAECLTLNETLPSTYKFQHLFSTPAPVWLRAGDYYLYSAFWNSDGKDMVVKALGVGPVHANVTDYQCHVWFDHRDVIFSVHGQLAYSMVFSNLSLAVYNLFCKVDKKQFQGLPYMFVLLYKIKPDDPSQKTFIPVFLSNTSHSHTSTKNVGACVKPDYAGLSKTNLIEFIAFHQIVGLSQFIVYDNGIHHGLLTKLKSLELVKSLFLSINILVWNFPYQEASIESKALEIDCLSRTSGLLGGIGILEWDQYIIPKKRASVPKMLMPYDLNNQLQVKINSQICCINMKNDKRSDISWPLVLKSTRCIKIHKYVPFILHPTLQGKENEITLNSLLGVVSIFRNCEGPEQRVEIDRSSHHFISDLMLSMLLKVWKSGILFT